MPEPTSWYTITSAPSGENTSPAGTESIPVTGSKYLKISTLRDYIWNYLTSLTAKTTLADADQISLADSAASNAAKKITWANVMTAILAYTGTFTNKRITLRSSSITFNATPTWNTDNADVFVFSGLSGAITNLSTNMTGTPTDWEKKRLRFLDDGTARAITPGANFVNGPASFPTTTVLSKWLCVDVEWNPNLSKWMCMAEGSGQ